MADVPHFAYPFRVGADGSFVVDEQDSQADVAGCVRSVVATQRGDRVELPEFGIDDPTFSGGVNGTILIQDIQDWEPRAQIDVTAEIDSVDELISRVTVDVSVEDGGSEL